MKKVSFISILFSIAMVIASLTANANAAASQTVTLDIPGMSCKFCPITIRKALEKVPGVIKAQADFESKTATVTYDPDKTTPDTATIKK